MALVTVAMSDLAVTSSPDDVLVTYALGSCIAVVVYDPTRKVGGMIHYMLPSSSVSPEKARDMPAMFADTGVPALFHRMYAEGCAKQHLIVKVVGGAKLYEDNGTFDIGRRNYATLRQMLWKAGLLIASEDVGGCKSRTPRLFVASGRVIVRSAAEDIEL